MTADDSTYPTTPDCPATSRRSLTERLHSTLSTGAFVSNTRYIVFARRSLTLVMLLHLLFVGVFVWLRLWPLVLMDVGSVLFYAWCIRKVTHRRFGGIHSVVVTQGLLHSAVVCWAIGIDSGFQLFSWLLIPLVMVCTYHSRLEKILRISIVLAWCLGASFALSELPPLVELSAGTLRVLRTINLFSYLSLMALLSYVYAETVASFERRLHRHASTDALTGLRNRRRMVSLAQESMAHAQQTGTPLSAILCDIDHFKSINDRFGHATGDVVLMAVAGCLHEVVRHANHVARWGGEEFLILLPAHNLRDAMLTAEELRTALQRRSAGMPDPQLRFTLSFGVAEWSRGSEDFDTWVARADDALYEAKLAGRDRIRSSETPPLKEHAVESLLTDTRHPLAANPSFHETTTAAIHKTQAMPHTRRPFVNTPKR